MKKIIKIDVIWYFGTITIIRKNEKDIVIKFSDINDKIKKILKKKKKQ